MEKLELKNRKGQKIVGVLERPEGEIKGTCIVEHGWGGSKERPTTQAIKNGFLESGFQTFNFDATNSFNESEGDFEKSTLGLHWEDFEDVTKWTKQQPWFGGSFAVAGHSMGGYAAARYAEDYPEEVSFVVAVAPVVSGKLSYEAYEEGDPGGLERWRQQGIIEEYSKKGYLKKKNFLSMEERLNHDLIPNASNITMPILFVVGSEDTHCPPKHIKTLFDAIVGTKKTIKIIEGAPHSFYKPEETQACRNLIKEWLKHESEKTH